MTGARPLNPETAIQQARQLVSRGLPALIAGGAVLIAAVWLLAWQLADVLARTHVQQKMQDVAAKAESVLREPGAPFSGKSLALSPRTRQALADLARFRDIYRMELRDGQGNIVWRNVSSISRVKRSWPKDGGIVIERRNVDGLLRSMARYRAQISTAGGRTLHLLMELDATPQLTAYHRVALLVAKAITTVVLAAMLLMGWMLMLRAREREALVRKLAESSNDNAAPADEAEGLRHQIEELSAKNAALLRRMAKLAGDSARANVEATPRTAARRANGGEA